MGLQDFFKQLLISDHFLPTSDLFLMKNTCLCAACCVLEELDNKYFLETETNQILRFYGRQALMMMLVVQQFCLDYEFLQAHLIIILFETICKTKLKIIFPIVGLAMFINR